MEVQKRLKNSVSPAGTELFGVRGGNPTVEPYLFIKLIIQDPIAGTFVQSSEPLHSSTNAESGSIQDRDLKCLLREFPILNLIE